MGKTKLLPLENYQLYMQKTDGKSIKFNFTGGFNRHAYIQLYPNLACILIPIITKQNSLPIRLTKNENGRKREMLH